MSGKKENMPICKNVKCVHHFKRKDGPYLVGRRGGMPVTTSNVSGSTSSRSRQNRNRGGTVIRFSPIILEEQKSYTNDDMMPEARKLRMNSSSRRYRSGLLEIGMRTTE